MPVGTGYSLAEVGRIATLAKHVSVVIGFQYDQISAAHGFHHIGVRRPKICCERDRALTDSNDEPDRTYRIMRDPEAHNLDIAKALRLPDIENRRCPLTTESGRTKDLFVCVDRDLRKRKGPSCDRTPW